MAATKSQAYHCLHFHFEISLRNCADKDISDSCRSNHTFSMSPYLTFYTTLASAFFYLCFLPPSSHSCLFFFYLKCLLTCYIFSSVFTSDGPLVLTVPHLPAFYHYCKKPHPPPSRVLGLPAGLHFSSRFSLVYNSH